MEYLAWPLSVCGMVLILGLVVVVRHDKEIGRLIDRTKSIGGKSGVQTTDVTDALASKQEAVVQTAPTEPSATDKLLQAFDNQLLLEQENLITSWLNGLRIHNPTEREQVLTRYFAGVALHSRFESVYNSVFGTQLRALETLNLTAPDGVPPAALQLWYETGKANFPVMYRNGAYTFDEWLGFMRGMVLVKDVGPHVFITVFGREFLKYMIDSGYSMDKNG